MTSYTHWAYFKTQEQVEACKAELPDYVTRIDGPTNYRDDWLLRVGHDIPEGSPDGWRDEVKDAVDRHGGEYDGGEMAFGLTESGWGSIPDPSLASPSGGESPSGECEKELKAALDEARAKLHLRMGEAEVQDSEKEGEEG